MTPLNLLTTDLTDAYNRNVLADWLEDQSRHEEAALLREDTDIVVRNGKVISEVTMKILSEDFHKPLRVIIPAEKMRLASKTLSEISKYDEREDLPSATMNEIAAIVCRKVHKWMTRHVRHLQMLEPLEDFFEDEAHPSLDLSVEWTCVPYYHVTVTVTGSPFQKIFRVFCKKDAFLIATQYHEPDDHLTRKVEGHKMNVEQLNYELKELYGVRLAPQIHPFKLNQTTYYKAG